MTNDRYRRILASGTTVLGHLSQTVHLTPPFTSPDQRLVSMGTQDYHEAPAWQEAARAVAAPVVPKDLGSYYLMGER